MGLDDPPTEEVKVDQKAFFGLLYHLLVDAERGPRSLLEEEAVGGARAPLADGLAGAVVVFSPTGATMVDAQRCSTEPWASSFTITFEQSQ